MEVRCYATQALINLSFDEANVEGIMNAGAGRPLVEMLNSPQTDASLLEHILTVLTNLAMSSDDMVSFITDNSSTVEKLISLMRNSNGLVSPAIRLRSINLLTTIARIESARRALLELGTLPIFQEISALGNSDSQPNLFA